MPPTTQKQIRAVACKKLEKLHAELENLERHKPRDPALIRYVSKVLLEALTLLQVQVRED
jgi:hypothetical protein